MNYSLTGLVVPMGELYDNDLHEGDREATQEEIEAHEIKIAEQEAKLNKSLQRDQAMLEGSTYTLNGTDYKVSFTKDDGDGMVQVKNGFDLGLESTVIHFDSGTKMPISSSEFLAFATWFVTERNKFFIEA